MRRTVYINIYENGNSSWPYPTRKYAEKSAKEVLWFFGIRCILRIVVTMKDNGDVN